MVGLLSDVTEICKVFIVNRIVTTIKNWKRDLPPIHTYIYAGHTTFFLQLVYQYVNIYLISCND